MKSWKVLWIVVVAGTLFSGFLTACGKKGDDSNALNYGSLNSDGVSVSSTNSLVQGMPLSLTMQNISVLSTGYNQTTAVGQTAGGQLRFDVTINGQALSVNTNSTWVGWQQVAGWYLASTGICTNPTCSIVIVSVVVTPSTNSTQNYDFRQIAVKKDLANNRVLALREFQISNTNMLHSSSQLAGEL